MRKDNAKTMNDVWEVSTGNFSKRQLPFTYKEFDALLGAIFCTGLFYYYVIDFSSFPELKLSYMTTRFLAQADDISYITVYQQVKT